MFIEYVHPTNKEDDIADVFTNEFAVIDGLLNVPYWIKLEPDGGGGGPPPNISGTNPTLHIPIVLPFDDGSYPWNNIVWLPVVILSISRLYNVHNVCVFGAGN